MAGKIDVCYTVGTGSAWNDNELRYSLRALEKNFLDLGRVFICGECPSWLTNVIHIDVPDLRQNKDANIIDKTLAACRAGISEQFIRSSDDEMIIAPCHVADMRPYHWGNLREKGAKFFAYNKWHGRLLATMKFLRKRRLPTWHFDTHIPTVFNKASFERTAAACPYKRNGGFTISTLFLNHERPVTPPQLDGQKFTLYSGNNNLDDLRRRVVGKRYIGYNNAGLTAAFKRLLQEMFPTPSSFETDGAAHVQNISYRDTVILPTVVAVLGAARSGTSCTAGILHALGVSMGERLRPPAKRNPKGFFEAAGLREACGARVGPRNRVKLLRKWAARRAKGRGLLGGKDARLCGMIPVMHKAWPGMKAVAVDRPVAEIVASMQNAGSFKRLTPERMERRALRRIATRDRDLEKFKIPTLRLPFPETVTDPAGTVAKIIAFLGITPTAEQIAAALKFVDPTLKHHTVETP